MKENNGKEVVDEASRPEAQSQPRPVVGDKRKSLSKAIDLENLPSRRKEKRAKSNRLSLGWSSLGSLFFLPLSNRLSKSMMWTLNLQEIFHPKLYLLRPSPLEELP